MVETLVVRRGTFRFAAIIAATVACGGPSAEEEPRSIETPESGRVAPDAASLIAAETLTRVSHDAWAANGLVAPVNGWPVSSAISAATSSAKPGGAFRPVPTAVPPMARR